MNELTIPGTKSSWQICWGQRVEESRGQKMWQRELGPSRTKATWLRSAALQMKNWRWTEPQWKAKLHHWKQIWKDKIRLHSRGCIEGYDEVFSAPYCNKNKMHLYIIPLCTSSIVYKQIKVHKYRVYTLVYLLLHHHQEHFVNALLHFCFCFLSCDYAATRSDDPK